MLRGRMFLDWCPLPHRVQFVSHFSMKQMIGNWRDGYMEVSTDLNLYAYRMEDGSMFNRAYGWEPVSKTMYVYKKFLED